ncbi:MAG TPA: L-threonylcarbamoyladenylate synthase [Clostridia bacterium]|nr:L-threonylcarbamoyladenylate synthase [Clostridia bacterium]
MQTQRFKITTARDTEQINAAAEILRKGGLVAIPTETVYGLAANALAGEAVSKIFKAKGRPQDNPLIVHISSFQEIFPLVKTVPNTVIKLAKAFWPGPLTIVLKKADLIPDEVSAGLDTVAVRMPSHPVARALIKAAGVPLAAPSANTSGSPSPTSVQHVLDDLDGRIDAVVDAGECTVGVESTVITLVGKTPRLLRPGGVTPEQLEEVLGKIEIDDAVFGALLDDEIPVSPGMKYKHYSPKAKLLIVKGNLAEFIDYVQKNISDGTVALCYEGEQEKMPVRAISFGGVENPTQQAQKIFSALRQIDALPNVHTVLARCPVADGLGLAVYNRLLRAASFEVIEL